MAETRRAFDAAAVSQRFFLALATAAPLVLLVDDIHAADNDSLPVFASLAKAAAKQRLLMVASFDTDDPGANRPALQLLRRGSGRIRLDRSISNRRSASCVRSSGTSSSTKRLAAWLQQQTGGNPSLCSELVSHLVKEGRIHYAEGTWVLPHDFPEAGRARSDDRDRNGHLARLRPALRRFAECLSPHRRSLDGELCVALSEGDPELAGADIERLLDELVREGVLSAIRAALRSLVPRCARSCMPAWARAGDAALHRHAALKLAERAADNPEREFEVGRHLLLAGDRAGAYDRISLSVVEVVSRPDALVRSVPELRDLYEEYRRIGGTADELLQVTASLVVSGYYVDPTVHDELGDSTAELLQRRTGFALAARLTPWLGSYPALFVGMAWGLVQYVRSARTLRIDRFSSMILSFVGVCASRSAVGYLRIEPHTHDLLLRLLAPAKGLHRHNALRLVHDLDCDRDRGKARARSATSTTAIWTSWRGCRTSGCSRKTLAITTRPAFCAASGAAICCVSGDGALAVPTASTPWAASTIASSLSTFAAPITCTEAKRPRPTRLNDVLDAMAARYGYRWIPDILAVLDFVPYHLSADVVGLKRVLHWTERLLAVRSGLCDVPGRDPRHVRGPSRATRASRWSSTRRSEPRSARSATRLGRSRTAHRAECLNALGRHEEALAVCQDALRHVGALSRVFVVAYQQLERESAIALRAWDAPTKPLDLLDELLSPPRE